MPSAAICATCTQYRVISLTVMFSNRLRRLGDKKCREEADEGAQKQILVALQCDREHGFFGEVATSVGARHGHLRRHHLPHGDRIPLFDQTRNRDLIIKEKRADLCLYVRIPSQVEK